MIQFAASSPSSTCHHRRSAGPRNTGVVVPARCAVVKPSPKTKTSGPDADRSAIRCSSSLAGSLIFAALLILCSPKSVPLPVGNTAPHKIDTRRPSRLKLERAQPEPLLAKPLAAPFRLHGRYEPCRRCGCCICWSLPTALIIDGAERVWPYERACRPQGNRKGKSTVSWRQLSPLHFMRRGSDQGVPCVGQQ